MPEARHVFISYSRTDTAVMQRVKKSLLDHPLPVWTDEGIAPGTPSWKRAISNAIEQSCCLVCLLSPDAKNSEWVQRELDYAEAHGKPVFALMVRGTTTTSVPFALIGTQYVDIQQDFERGMGRLLPILASVCALVSPADPQLTRLPLLEMSPDPEATVVSHAVAIEQQTQIDSLVESEKAPARPKPLLEHIPTLEAAPVDYSKIKPATRNRDWAPIIRVINGIEMCLVPPGCFMMGSEEIENANPVHQRCFDKPFWIGRYPVTNAQYGEAAAADVCKPSAYTDDGHFTDPQQPVVGINWHQARTFAGWKGMRLPTETEWEYAARGPESWIWPWGNEFVTNNLVYNGNSDLRTAPVGNKPHGAAWAGPLDMSGNVLEWCLTRWRNPYDSWEDNDLEGDSPRVLRGGSWLFNLHYARAASRDRSAPGDSYYTIGFRVVFDPAAGQ